MITKSRENQRVFIAESWDECSEHMYKFMAEGYVVTNLDYYNNYYAVVMDKGTAWSGQEILFSADFPTMKINDYWDKGLDITYVAGDDIAWMFFFSKGSGIAGQEWKFKSNWEELKPTIRSLWKQNKVITDMRQSFGGIVVVMSGGLNWSQLWSLTDNWPYDIIQKEKEENKRFITHLAMIENKIFMVYSDAGYKQQEIHRFSEFISAEEELDKAWKKGMMLTTLSFINEELVMVFSN